MLDSRHGTVFAPNPSFVERHQQPILTAATRLLYTETAMPLGRDASGEQERVDLRESPGPLRAPDAGR